jgi:hypothetical protein
MLTRPTILLILALHAAALAADPARSGGVNSKETTAGLGQEKVTVDEPTERIIRGALRYLASKQNGNGSWSASDGDRQEAAMTGYVLITFLSCGQLPDEGEFGRNVTNGMNFLLASVRDDGTFPRVGHYMYGHGVASIALAELYGQTKDPRIRPKLEAVIKLIVSCQNKEGGWRYNPRPLDADISVTVLQVVALRAAKNSGIDVPQATIDRAVQYVLSCRHKGTGGFTYQARGGDPGFARTAAALYSLQVCGQYDHESIKPASDYLFSRRNDRQWFTYGNFYAAPAQYMIGGETWERWYDYMRKTLTADGAYRSNGDLIYWEPKWDGGRGVGPVYCTAVYAMVLAMPYHYLPLYQR